MWCTKFQFVVRYLVTISCLTLPQVTGNPEPTALPVQQTSSTPSPRCRVSELECANKRCVPADRFCDAVNDCGDSSDEPRHCSRCNRTYHGDVGRTYNLELHRPREDRLPYVCLITIEAAGGIHGDLVQVTFDSFTIGRFASFTTDGCPDGSLQIAESGRPQAGGAWCGTSWGPAVYYSETNSITLYVRLLRLSKDQNNYNFDFRIEYKVLRRDDATVRYGGAVLVPNFPQAYRNNTNFWRADVRSSPPPPQEFYLGDLISGTYCSRIFSDCDRKPCRLQSPNFPGVYPRNLTCYYAVRHHEAPEGKHALITVKQPNGQLVSIRSVASLYAPPQPQHGSSQRELKVWSHCDDVQDYVTIYDGYTTRDPVILKFCGGGVPVPEAISSGPELLVEFTSSPFGTFLHPSPFQSLHGFQLEVEVKFVDMNSPTYAKNKRACEFWIRGTGRGVLENPQHTLPPNTTCLYHMQGIDTSISISPGPMRTMSYPWRRPGFPYPSPRFRVWFSVLKFHVVNALDPNLPEEEYCGSHLNVWDGPMRISPGCSDIFCDREKSDQASRAAGSLSVTVGRPPSNATLLARYCRGGSGAGRGARTCERALLAPAAPAARPCTRARDAYVSRGDSLTLELKSSDSTALKPVYLRALYEFVDLQQDGSAWGRGPCSRVFRAPTLPTPGASPQRRFASPKDVFLYGRGGATNLSCLYRFEAPHGERVKLTILSLTAGKSGACQTRESSHTSRLVCLGRGVPAASLRIYERPWGDIPSPALPRDCICSSGQLPFTFGSATQTVELRFEVTGMTAVDDYKDFNFEASYEFVKAPICDESRKLGGASGKVDFHFPSLVVEEPHCSYRPWLVVPRPGRYLYVQIRGTLMKEGLEDVEDMESVEEPRVDPHSCATRSRVAVYAGGPRPVVVCPLPPHEQRHQVVEVFSEGWNGGSGESVSVGGGGGGGGVGSSGSSGGMGADELGPDRPRAVAVEFISRDNAPAHYAVTWLELTRVRHHIPYTSWASAMSGACTHRCPELDACINVTLWCDGVSHCPSGYDESLAHCSLLLQLPAQYLALVAALLLALLCFACYLLLHSCKRRRSRTSVLQQRLKSLSSETTVFDEKEVIS